MAWHAALDALARDFLENDGLHILFQYDPISQADTAENRLRDHLAQRMRVIDGRMTVHDLDITPSERGSDVRFDCFIPPDVDIPEKELGRMLENIVRELYPGCGCDITIDRDYMASPHYK